MLITFSDYENIQKINVKQNNKFVTDEKLFRSQLIKHHNINKSYIL